MKNKIILLSVIVVAVALFFVFDLGKYLSLESLKSNRDQLRAFYEANAVVTIAAFLGVYIVSVALSLPGATILTLCAGAIFGSVTGTLVVNVGATIGATLAFLAARFLLRDWVEKKFGEKLKRFNDGFSSNAINYMLFLRLVPALVLWTRIFTLHIPVFSGQSGFRSDTDSIAGLFFRYDVRYLAGYVCVCQCRKQPGVDQQAQRYRFV